MKPASSQTTSRLVWVARAALKGMNSCRPSMPMWAKPMMKPYTSCKTSSNMQVAKKAHAILVDSY